MVGHSFGAYLGLLLALRRKLEISRLVCLSPLAHMEDVEKQQLTSMAAGLEAGIDLADAIIPMWFSPGYARVNPGLRETINGWVASSRPGLVADLLAVERWDDLRPALYRVAIPVHLRTGTCDVVTPPRRMREIGALIPSCTMSEAPGKGHMLGLEDPVGGLQEA